MRKKWFYKTTNPIPVIEEANDFGWLDGTHYRKIFAQGGLNSYDGRVFINYNFQSMWNPLFLRMHYHEFLHRLFWLLKWERIDRFMDRIEHAIFIWSIRKQLRKRRFFWFSG